MRNPALLLLIAITMLGCAQEMPADLEEHVATIRQEGMTDRAEDWVRTIASIRLGGVIVEYAKNEDTGIYSPTLTSTWCPLPNVDPEMLKREREERERKMASELQKLRKVADFDQSGFVASEEGMRFRVAMEFGLKASYVWEQQGRDIGRLAEAMGLSLDELQRRIDEYNGLVSQLPEYRENGFPALAVGSHEGT